MGYDMTTLPLTALPVPEFLAELLFAIAIGGLIGIERENEPSRKYAGVRTLALLAAGGPTVVALQEALAVPFLVLLYVGIVAAFAASIVFVRLWTQGDVGFTTSMASFLVGLVGIMVGADMYFEAVALGMFTALLLAEKERMHSHVSRLTNEEISDAVKVMMLVFILYPILPAGRIGPYGAVSLQETLLLAIFVLLIEFVAFVSMRQVGSSVGLQVTGLLGGMANSFATTGVLARISDDEPEAARVVSSGIMLSQISGFVRNVFIAGAIAVALVPGLLAPVGGMVALALVVALVFWRGVDDLDFDVPMESPLSFRSAGKFALLFILISVSASVAEAYIGSIGLYVTAFLGGAISSAAVATSAASLLSGGSIEPMLGSGMVLVAMLGSMTAKMVLVETTNPDLRRTVTAPLVGVALVGLLVFVAL